MRMDDVFKALVKLRFMRLDGDFVKIRLSDGGELLR